MPKDEPILSKSKRPKLPLSRTPGGLVLEGLALAGVVFSVAVVARAWSGLPKTIPIHFNLSGEADGWGSKGALLLLPGIAVALYMGLTVLQRFPHTYNYAWRITAENAAAQYANARSMLKWLKAETVWLMGILSWQITVVAAGRAKGLEPWLVPVWLAVIFATVAVHLFRAYRLS